MNGTIYQRIEDNAHFRELVEKQATVCHHPVDYYAGSLYRLYFTDRLRARLAGHAAESEHHSVTRGIPIGVGVIVISFVLTGIYIWRANGEFDRLNNEVLHEVQAS
ncbi:inner membrane protein YjcH [Escherichia coli]|uniref:Inner membrane protein YjcH n=1 Tax=Escherichia coli TaxID=562 RepID=A0A376L693_ECOLX|nr:inner membrane protein YjcH [Escherichia coli]